MFVVIDYDMGNLKSMSNALKALGVAHAVSGDPAVVSTASAIVLPGVGAFGDGMQALRRRNLVDVLEKKVLDEGVPYLGVCLGMQFLADVSREHGEHRGLGWLGGSVERLAPADPALKVPHMGWNELAVVPAAAGSPLVRDVTDHTAVYFLHGYHFVPADRGCVVATTDHGGPIVAAVERGHVFGVQFHPEKSQGVGLAILRNFADYAQGHVKEAPDSIAARP